MVSACTIVARNYLAHARVLADSFFAHHPDGNFTVLLIDDEERAFDASRESFQCLRLNDIGLNRAEIGQLAAIYDVTELATAVKPPFLRHLLADNRSDIVYLDPDIKVFDSLEDVSRLARQHSIVLTPHTMDSLPRDGRKIDLFQILAAGVYNLGFIAVGPGSETFLDWWWEKTRREARSDPTRMMFTDQRWVDFVPCFFDHFILKDSAYNVAYWNLHARDLRHNGGGYSVDGQPLKFFHFSGYDGRKPYLLSKHQGERPRILLSDRPALARLCHEYRADLERAGLTKESALPYGWNRLASGARFDRQMRRVYREGLEAYEKDGGPEPPNPFVAEDEPRFMDWLNEPVPKGLRPQVSRYLFALHQARTDLQEAFPDVTGRDCQAFFEWVRTDGMVQETIPPALVPPVRETSAGRLSVYVPPSDLSEGVNIAGYFRAEVGVGEAARLLTTAVEAAGIPYSTLAYDATPSRRSHPFQAKGNGTAPYDINVVCVNADRTPTFAEEAGPGFRAGRHTAGYWFWELERFPSTMHAAFDYVDEVWTATRFVAGAIQAIGRRPVFTIPLPVPVPRCSPHVTRASLRLPSGFMFLFVFDFFSVLERKNPIGLIKAFERAFRVGEGPILVIKTINGDSKLNHLEKVRASTDRPDILVVDEYYSAEEKNSLLSLCDCYVSLHRSEGLGLTMAEAMALEKPVIATGYSGNLDFMTVENSYLVDYVKSEVPAGCDPYPVGTPWAEPDLEQAAGYMRRVYEAREEAAHKARRARQDILTRHNPDAAALILKRRVDDIRHTRRRVAVTAGPTSATASSPGIATLVHETQDPLVTSFDHLTGLLTPTPSVPPGRRFRRPLLMLQGLLFRILRPYWWQQRQIDTGLIEGLRELSQAAGHAQNAERHQQERFESLWIAVHSLQNETTLAMKQVSALQENTLQVSALQSAVQTFQAAAAAHLKATTDQLATTTADLATLSQRLYAVPYMNDPDHLYYTDDRGRRVLGFQSGDSASRSGYIGFEDIFRGSEAFIRDRFHVYLPLLKRHARVVDIGCGRGELLDLLREANVQAIGVDVDAGMVKRCRMKEHATEHIDGNAFLRAQPDSSLQAITAIQVVEHLPHDELMSFLELSHAKLASGGQLIFETVNPHALEAFKTFWTDLTHQRPIFPEVAVALCSLTGFDRAHVFFPNGTGDLDHDRPVQGEYAVVATKGKPD